MCDEKSLGLDDLDGQIDFALVYAVAHEVDDLPLLFQQIHRSLKPGGQLLLAEPRGHVSTDDFEQTISYAVDAGFMLLGHPELKRSRTVLLASS